MQVSADRYEDYAISVDGIIIKYDAALATENFRQRNRYEAQRCVNMVDHP